MDPLAHTLFGAALAESGLKRRTRYATATLLIGANLPDLDAIATLWGNDFALFARRGHTHGILAMLVLPLLLAGAVLLWHRWRGHRGSSAVPLRPGGVLALSFLAVLSHPLLDWLNTYGVRLLMPFDGRWFYGDTLFIVEPWFWVLAAVGVVLARSATRPAIAAWLALAGVATGLVLGTDLVPASVKVLWCVALAVIVALRAVQPRWATSVHLARAGLAGLLLYIGAAYALARVAESALQARYPQALRVQANPPPALPLAHRMVIEEADRYRIVAAQGPVHEIPRVPADPIVQAALASPSVRGFVTWMRFPDWSVEDAGDHWRVRLRDLRYQGPDVPATAGIGAAEVQVPKQAVRGNPAP